MQIFSIYWISRTTRCTGWLLSNLNSQKNSTLLNSDCFNFLTLTNVVNYICNRSKVMGT